MTDKLLECPPSPGHIREAVMKPRGKKIFDGALGEYVGIRIVDDEDKHLNGLVSPPEDGNYGK